MSLLSRIVQVLIISGALAIYFNYGRNLIKMLHPALGDFPFISDWIGLFIVLTVAYLIAWVVKRRMEGKKY